MPTAQSGIFALGTGSHAYYVVPPVDALRNVATSEE